MDFDTILTDEQRAMASVASSQLSRRILLNGGLSLTALTLAACGGGSGLDPLPSGGSNPAGQPASPTGTTIGTGSVRVGLILPLTASGAGASVGAAIRNAAELAMSEFQQPDITLLVKDSKGDPASARAATQEALQEGAEVILGPLTAPEVQQAGALARAAGKPMIAFSSDTSVAQPGVYLLSFPPQNDVARIMGFAAQRGKRSIGAILPEGAFGNVIFAEYQQQITRLGLQAGPVRRYQPGSAAAAALALAAEAGTMDALLTTDLTDGMPGLADAVGASGIRNVQVLGTGSWNDLSVLGRPALQNAWFAAPEAAGFNAFAERYRRKFNSNPTRTATLGFDSTALVAALVRLQGSQRFSQQTLTNPTGFAGQDGIFRFRQDGTNERAVAVFEVVNRAAQTLSPAPRSFRSQT
jgi:ABC-type branched-subunit amino acid transport system substrate-binding protein